jgi:hypothetical protein
MGLEDAAVSTSIHKFSQGLRELPRLVANRAATLAADRFTAVAMSTFERSENAYGRSWILSSKGERVTLRDSGSLARTIRYKAIGTRIRVELGTSYAKYQVGRRPTFPTQTSALPPAYADALKASLAEALSVEVEALK